MVPDGPRSRTRRTGYGRFVLAIGLAAAQAASAAAQEPLLIRVRPRQEIDAAAAAAAREALWARRQDHARAVIASVCVGCLRPRHSAATVGPAERVAALAGLETDPVPGASGGPLEPATTQERP